jgi:hypothetical protein
MEITSARGIMARTRQLPHRQWWAADEGVKPVHR